jgi:hypothetical protein
MYFSILGPFMITTPPNGSELSDPACGHNFI